MRLIIHSVALALRSQYLRVVELVHAVAEVLIQLLLGDFVPAVTAVLRHHQILLVLLLEELFIDLGDVLRDDLSVRVWVRSVHRDRLEAALWSR